MFEHSRQYLLQAQVDYWSEMLAFNSGRLPEKHLQKMRHQLEQAKQQLIMNRRSQFRLAA